VHPSIAPGKPLRALVVQMLNSIRSERLLTEEIEYSILFRWFVGLNLDEEVREATVFTKNRDRLLEANIQFGPVSWMCRSPKSFHCSQTDQ
jgi:transposase